jgi:sugar phosphate isomerase/epimerase
MSARSVLGLVSLAVVAFAAPLPAAFQEHVGLQLYSLRELAKDSPLAALDQAKAFGLTEVETAGTGNLTAEQFRAALDARGLKAISAHVQYPAMEKDLAGVIATVKTLGANYAICPWIPHQGPFDAAVVQRAAENFNRWGAEFRAAGIKLGYHPHGYEFVPGDKSGTTRFDEFVAATDPQNVCLQLDVYWAYVGGADPVALLNKYGSRWVSLHVKDVRVGVERAPGKSRTEPTDKVIVGTGQIDWKAVIGAAEKAGVVYYIIEDESPEPVANIPLSAKYLRALKL